MQRISRNIFLLCLLSPLFSLGQTDNDRTPRPAPSFSITTIPVRCILRDVNIGITKPIGVEQTLEMRLGFVHSNKVLEKYYQDYFTSSEMQYNGVSAYFQWNFWKLNLHNKHWYFGPIVGYRYLWYHNKSLWLGGTGGSSFSEWPVLSQWRNDVFMLFALGRMTSKVSCTEVSLGARMSFTHTFVNDTRFHIAGQTPEEYEQYKEGVKSDVPGAEGLSIWPVVRVTTRLGRFEW